MDDTTIRISKETKKRLSEHGKHGQNFDDIVNELLNKVNGVKKG